jgi:hypothetical protein
MKILACSEDHSINFRAEKDMHNDTDRKIKR